VLSDHEAVADVAVIGASDPDWGERPVAFAVLRRDGAATAREILSWSLERLGKPQRPRDLYLLDTLPRTAAGKVDRAALRSHTERQGQNNAR